jgi:hypothetical protein
LALRARVSIKAILVNGVGIALRKVCFQLGGGDWHPVEEQH